MPDVIGAPVQKPQEYDKPQSFISQSVKNLTTKDPSFVENCIAYAYYRPIPTVDQLLTEISNAKVFTLADIIKSTFWHVNH